MRRFHAAKRLAKSQLQKIRRVNSNRGEETRANIFDAQQLILEDKSLGGKIEDCIRNNKINAEWAVKLITDSYIADYKAIADEHLRERYVDLEDIAERLLTALGGAAKPRVLLPEDAIIVAREITPSTLMELTESNPKAIVTERGGWTSHAFILAREINLPAVTGVKGVMRRVKTGDDVIVDGFHGQVIFNPAPDTLQKFKVSVTNYETPDFENSDDPDGKVKTLDGREVIIRANIDSPRGLSKAAPFLTHGVGLYRSEFLFNQNRGFPSEQEQIEAYRKIGDLAGENGAKIRTFDINIDRFAAAGVESEQNPALGMRGIRLSLAHQKQFRVQIRALLQASAGRSIDIILPMISDISEILATKKIIEAEKSFLRKKNVAIGEPRLGAMIEIPATVFIADEIAGEVDFLSLGTNDLVQYLLAVDRDNESVADSFRTLHPAVIRSIKRVVEAAEKNDKPLIVCGEMAGSPVYVTILIGLGVKELSMNLNSFARVGKTISAIAYEETREVCRQIKECRTSDEIESLVNNYCLQKWSHLFSTENLPLKKSKQSLNKK